MENKFELLSIIHKWFNHMPSIFLWLNLSLGCSPNTELGGGSTCLNIASVSEGVVLTLLNFEFSFMNQATNFSFTNKHN